MTADTNKIVNFLNNNFVKGAHSTHVSMMQPTGKFFFTKEIELKFWELYLEAVDKEKENLMLGIAEKSSTELPILVDVDLKVEEDDHDTYDLYLYTEEQVNFVINTYQNVLKDIIEDCTDNNLICLLLQKPKYRVIQGEVSYLKNGFHLHFPNLFVETHILKTQIIPRVQEILKINKTFENLGYDNSGEVIDANVCKVPWLLYGSRKSPDQPAYKFTKAFKYGCEEISLAKVFSTCILKDIKGYPIKIENKYEYYLPLLLSISPITKNHCIKQIKKGLVSPLKEKIRFEKRLEYKTLDTENNVKLVKELLPIISSKRSIDRNDWMTIGWILYNITEGNEEGLNLWLEFSQRAPELYNEDICIHEWEKMEKREIGIGTLKFFASQDDPIEYNNFKKRHSKKHMEQSIDGSHNSIAKLLFEEFGDKYRCASYDSGLWYEFIGHIWEPVEGAVTLRQKLSNEITKMYQDKILELKREAAEAEDIIKIKYEQTIKNYNKVVTCLGSSPFKNNVIKEAKEIFYDKNFKDKLNSNPWLIAFDNGIYDLKINNFRDGHPDDYISKKMKIPYIEFTNGHEDLTEIYSYFEKVFPDCSVRQYFLDVVCETFVGGNFKKIGLLWTGEGDNAKSVTQSFFEKMFGPYAVKLNTSILTGKKLGGGSANADLARTGDGVRWVVAEEPNNEEQINNGIYKNLTGLDSYFARDLFEKGKGLREIIPMYLLIIICNKLPRFKNFDIATFNRTRVIPFESTFCRPENPAPETWEEQIRQKRFPMDPEFGSKIDRLLPAFAYFLLNHRKNKKGGTLQAPLKVMAATEMYMKQNDIYRQFIDENVKIDKNSSISVDELYSIFKEWYKESMPGNIVPVKIDMKDYFCKLWGSINNNKWIGYSIKRELNTSISEVDISEEISINDVKIGSLL
jgi:P4 family phage/plasmid primase-like protien